MNLRGRLDWAADQAALSSAQYRLLKVLIRLSGNDTGEILYRYASSLEKVGERAKMRERTARRALSELRDVAPGAPADLIERLAASASGDGQ